MIERKPDASQIDVFIRGLAASLALDLTRAWWPGYLFHTTELHNAVDILDSGQLLSRRDIGPRMPRENANRAIIDHTPADIQQLVRFYFRPRTPMTHNNEGFRTPPNRNPAAYCPLPVLLVFPSLPILTAVGTQFSDGNCASSSTRRGETAEFLRSLPFADIFHDTAWLSEEEGSRIRRHRQAEVLRPSPFDIRPHRLQIRVRSIGERETLLSLLRRETADRYRNQIQVASKMPLFHKIWTYIESASALENTLTIRFNESTRDTNAFTLRLSCSALDGTPLVVREAHHPTIEPLRLSLSGSKLENEPFHLRVELEGDLAYSGVIDPRPRLLVGPR